MYEVGLPSYFIIFCELSENEITFEKRVLNYTYCHYLHLLQLFFAHYTSGWLVKKARSVVWALICAHQMCFQKPTTKYLFSDLDIEIKYY